MAYYGLSHSSPQCIAKILNVFQELPPGRFSKQKNLRPSILRAFRSIPNANRQLKNT